MDIKKIGYVATAYRKMQKTGRVLTQMEEATGAINKAGALTTELSGFTYYQVTSSGDACEQCRANNGAIYPVSYAKEGENFPPFHRNCECTVHGYSISNPYEDPIKAEVLLWLEITYGKLSLKQKAQKLIEFYSLDDYSQQFVERLVSVTGSIKHIGKRNEAFSYLMSHVTEMTGKEMGLPGEDVNYNLFRWENYTGLTAYNPGKMQDMAYTDEDGFRRINVDGLNEPAYMAALGSYYLKDENGKVNLNGVVFRVYLSNGNSFYMAAGDMKADKDTNPDSHQYTYNLNYSVDKTNADIIEFIIDKDNMDSSFWKNNFKKGPSYFQGEIVRIEKLDMTVL